MLCKALTCLLSLSVALGVARAEPDAPPPGRAGLVPVEDFFRPPRMETALLSPDGKFLAATIAADRGRMRLAVLDVAHPAEAKVVAAFDDADVGTFHWVNSDRLVFDVHDRQRPDGPLRPGLFGVNRDGSAWRQLIRTSSLPPDETASRIAKHELSWEWRLDKVLRDGSADVIVAAGHWSNTWEPTHVSLARLDTLTGVSTNLSAGAPEGAERWFVDSSGHPLAVATGVGSRQVTYLMTDKGWSVWQDLPRMQGQGLWPISVDPDGKFLVLRPKDSNFAALYEYDPVARQLSDQPLVSAPGYDINPGLVMRRGDGRVVGVHYETDAPGTVWFDPDLKAMQEEIDKQLPGMINHMDCGTCDKPATVLIRSFSDRSPPVFYLYERAGHALTRLSFSRPWIDPARMGQRDMFRFKARDGLSIPVLLTRPDPKSKQAQPAVVLVHGGPQVRGAHWGWEGMAQFLASRGYVVIEPEFRGSTGYGFDLFHAGWKQWGLRMQDDVSDAVQWAVEQGYVDPRRVCIGGASYGGYATLMGLIKTPELYRCGFEWVGVTDIDLMYSIEWSDSSEAWKQYGMPVLIGDRVADAKQLEATSPLKQAARLHRPLLMAYGANDHRVPLKHGLAFRDALSSAHQEVEFVVYPEEGHGWQELKTNIDFWTRVENFLGRHIGPGAPTEPAPSR